jgi:hypothetical protein
MPGCPVGFMDVTESPRARLGYPVCYTGVMEGSCAMPGCPVGFIDVMERSRAILGYPM